MEGVGLGFRSGRRLVRTKSSVLSPCVGKFTISFKLQLFLSRVVCSLLKSPTKQRPQLEYRVLIDDKHLPKYFKKAESLALGG